MKAILVTEEKSTISNNNFCFFSFFTVLQFWVSGLLIENKKLHLGLFNPETWPEISKTKKNKNSMHFNQQKQKLSAWVKMKTYVTC